MAKQTAAKTNATKAADGSAIKAMADALEKQAEDNGTPGLSEEEKSELLEATQRSTALARAQAAA